MLAAGSALSGAAPTSLLPSYLRTSSAGLPPARMPGEGGAPNPGPPITLTGPAGVGAPTNAPSSPPPVASPQNTLANDPAYQQAQADYNAALAAAASQRDASTNRALVQFGLVPDFGSIGKSLGLSDAQVKAIMGEINPETGALANQYTQGGNSVIAQLNRAHDQALKQLSSSLAARGALESGATGVGVGQENQNLQQGMSNAYQSLLDNLLGYQNDYATAAGGARSSLENSLSSAYDRAIQLAQQVPGYGSAPGDQPSTGGGAGAGAPSPPAATISPFAPQTTSGAYIGSKQKNPYQIARMFGGG